jgi:hypothetical protein
MPRNASLSRTQVEAARLARAAGVPFRSIARDLGVSHATVARTLSRVRTADEFRGTAIVQAPRHEANIYSWNIETIRAARDDQMAGRFKWPVALAKATRTDDAIFVAYRNRIAPQRAVRARLVSQDSDRGRAIAAKAADGVIAPRSVLSGIHGTLANHGVAVGHVEREVDEDGTRVSMRLREWPLEHVYWDPSREILMTSVRGALPVEIVHGNGEWIVFRGFDDLPWTQEACLLAIALLWAVHAGGLKDWAAASTAHGMSKVVGELAQGVPIADAAGDLSPDAQAFLNMLQDLVSGSLGAGVRPFGSKTEFVSNGSNAWQVFQTLIESREKAAARVYLGTDAILGSVGGAPGVDISALFGVASVILQGDLEVIEQALFSGLYQPWTAINFGDSRRAPMLEYELPDPDGERKAAEYATRYTQFTDTLAALRAAKADVTQDTMNEIAAAYAIKPVPQLASQETASVPLELAPTDIARVVRVREARASQGLPPLGDERDDLFVSELEARAQAKADAQGEIAVEQATPDAGSP